MIPTNRHAAERPPEYPARTPAEAPPSDEAPVMTVVPLAALKRLMRAATADPEQSTPQMARAAIAFETERLAAQQVAAQHGAILDTSLRAHELLHAGVYAMTGQPAEAPPPETPCERWILSRVEEGMSCLRTALTGHRLTKALLYGRYPECMEK